MKSYTLFSRTSGRTIRYGQAADATLRYMRAEMDYETEYLHVGGALAQTHWFDQSIALPEEPDQSGDPESPGPEDESARIVPRVDAGLVVSATEVNPGDTVSITNIPVGATFQVDNDVVVVEDGRLDLTLQTAGTYSVLYDELPYLPVRLEFNVGG